MQSTPNDTMKWNLVTLVAGDYIRRMPAFSLVLWYGISNQISRQILVSLQRPVQNLNNVQMVYLHAFYWMKVIKFWIKLFPCDPIDNTSVMELAMTCPRTGKAYMLNARLWACRHNQAAMSWLRFSLTTVVASTQQIIHSKTLILSHICCEWLYC